MKTYAETQNAEPFDWHAALADPPELGSPAHRILTNLSGRWVTCACGNQCSIIPRKWSGEPHDTYLMWLGSDFYGFVLNGCWNEARKTLAEIEQRSDELLTEMK